MADELEQKVEALSVSVDQRFDAVDAALIEQRQYTEFAYSELDAKIEARFAQVEAHFDKVEVRFDKVEVRFDKVEVRFDKVEVRFDKVDTRFDRLERKLDQVIDLHLRAPSGDQDL